MDIEQVFTDNFKTFKENLDKPFKPFEQETPSKQYVAFVDILGFGSKTIENYPDLLENYERLLDFIRIPKLLSPNVSVKIFSDSFIISSEDLILLAEIVKSIHMITLHNDFLIRGGIGFGSHLEVQNGADLYVVSQALVRAVEVEKVIKRPCVALHESVEISDGEWNHFESPFSRRFLYFDNIRIISPFNIFWGTTAQSRVISLSNKYPEHREKCDWFLNLYNAVISGDPLTPPEN